MKLLLPLSIDSVAYLNLKLNLKTVDKNYQRERNTDDTLYQIGIAVS